jgi:hypothetical protein
MNADVAKESNKDQIVPQGWMPLYIEIRVLKGINSVGGMICTIM